MFYGFVVAMKVKQSIKEKRQAQFNGMAYIGVAVPTATKDKLEEMRRRSERSLAAEVRVAISKHVQTAQT